VGLRHHHRQLCGRGDGLGFLHTRGAVLLWTPVALVAAALLVTWRTDDD
jgi:hypothetical protein